MVLNLFAGQVAGLPDPVREQRFVKLSGFKDMKVSHTGVLGRFWWHWFQVRAFEKGHFDIFRHAVKRSEGCTIPYSIEWRVQRTFFETSGTKRSMIASSF